VSALVLLQSFYLASYYPYYYPFENPIIKNIFEDRFSVTHEGYGEGLDLAAGYLSQKDDAMNLSVMSWFSGSLGYLFPGKTEHIIPQQEWPKGSARALKDCDYLVIYYDTQLRHNLPEKLMHDLTNVIPEHSIFLFGREYIRIYEVDKLPDSVFIHDT
jgi:hypothetical protein